MSDGESTDPASSFAALMSDAAATAVPEGGEAPYGMTRDRDTGELRPKKAQGRPKAPPSLDELKTAEATPAPAGDRAPAKGRRHRGHSHEGKPAAAEVATPQHRPGVITKGVNRLYRRAGKIVRAMDRDIGIAIIESTHNTAEDGEPDDSVGAAWDELARTNPAVRRFLLKCISGGAWGQLIMAHMPILLAILLKDGISKHIPFVKILAAMAEPEEGAEPGGLGGLLSGMSEGDMAQMAKLAQGLMGQTAAKAA